MGPQPTERGLSPGPAAGLLCLGAAEPGDIPGHSTESQRNSLGGSQTKQNKNQNAWEAQAVLVVGGEVTAVSRSPAEVPDISSGGKPRDVFLLLVLSGPAP